MLRVVPLLLCAAAAAQTPERVLQSMKGTAVPEPPNLGTYVANRAAAIALGKALYWDIQVSSDGRVSCASCHFHAGADIRVTNQIHPGADGAFAATRTGAISGPNRRLGTGDFPFRVLSDPADRNSTAVYDTNDVLGSQGVVLRTFTSATAGSAEDTCAVVAGESFRRATPRHAPAVINSVFHHRQFSDGRAPNSLTLTIQLGNPLAASNVTFTNASLAAQSLVPVLSDIEMSCRGRTWPQVGRRLLKASALRRQAVAADDSVLGAYAASPKGLRVTYEDLIKQAFAANLWNSTATSGGFSQAELNFPLFFALSVQLYEATLVSDDAPIDRYLAAYPATTVANAAALTTEEVAGLNIFNGKARCVSCHSGPQLSNAGTPSYLAAANNSLVESMIQGDGRAGSYDFGFYNIGVRPTGEDIALGGTSSTGQPFSLARRQITDGSRVTVDGAFKTPSLRNVALTGPYFHHGGVATLEDVIEFYNRGGDRQGTILNDTTGFGANPSNLGPDVRALGLAPFEKEALLAFLKNALLDQRVRFERAPFDHPELPIADGHNTDGSTAFVMIPAVGRNGLATPIDEFATVLAAGTLGFPPVPAGWPYSAPAVTLTAPSGTTSPITLNATATDADNDIVRVEFYANSTKLGEDTTAPYSFDWTSPANGTHTLVAKAIDAQGLSATSLPVTITISGGTGVNGLLGEYFDGTAFAGLRFSRTDALIDFTWGAAGPGQGLNPRSFSVRWTGEVEAPATGAIVFCSTADSGMRIQIQNQLIADNFFNGTGTTTACGSVAMTKGQKYPIRVDYYNDNGAGRALVRWWYAGGAFEPVPSRFLTSAAAPPPPVTGTGLTGTYFEGINFNTQKSTRVDAKLDFQWSTSGPGAGVIGAFYSVRWRGQIESPYTGDVVFCGTSDNALRVRVNGVEAVSSFYDHALLTTCGTVRLEQGKRYAIEADYFNNGGTGTARLQWWYPGIALQVVPTRFLFER